MKQIAYDAFQGQQSGALSDACRFHGAGSLVPSWTPLGALPLLLTYTVALFVLLNVATMAVTWHGQPQIVDDFQVVS